MCVIHPDHLTDLNRQEIVNYIYKDMVYNTNHIKAYEKNWTLDEVESEATSIIDHRQYSPYGEVPVVDQNTLESTPIVTVFGLYSFMYGD